METNFRTRNTPQDPPKPRELREPSRVQSHFAPDADVNNIVARHMRGIGHNLSNVGSGGTRQPLFGDFSNSTDFHAMLNKVTDIQSAFMRLPARLRSRHDNNPYQLYRWLEDPANLPEAVKKGLISLPEGFTMTEEGEIVEQLDVVTESKKEPPKPPEPALKADDEANPTFKGGKK